MLASENIAKVVTWSMTLPFYIYALIKWHQFNDHFLIKNRFPMLSYTLFCIMFIAQSISMIEGIVHDLQLHSYNIHHHLTLFIASLTFTISGLILYRINLIYLKWKAMQSISTSNIRMPAPPATERVDDTKNTPTLATKRKVRNIYRSGLSVMTLCFVCIGSLILYVSCVVSLTQNGNVVVYYIAITIYTLLCVFIAASIWNIQHKNVKEGTGCIKECYAILIALMIQMVLQSIFPDTHLHILVECSTFYLLNYQAIVTLYIPLYLLWKAEGTLDSGIYNKGLNEQIFMTKKNKRLPSSSHHPAARPSKPTEKVLALNTNVSDIDFVQDTKPRDSNTSKGPDLVRHASLSSGEDVIFVNESLFEFLYQNERNHQIFSDYLQFCFAIESLLFVERVSVFYQIVLEMKEEQESSKFGAKLPVMHYATSNSCSLPGLKPSPSNELSDFVSSEISSDLPDVRALEEPIPAPVSIEVVCFEARKEIHRLEFRYLKDIYVSYRQMIDEAVACEDHNERYDISNTKRALLDVCQEIYDQFVSVFAETQVNLSYGVQGELDGKLDRERADGAYKCETYDDFLMLFDHALIETYRLMVSAYLFGFKKYVKNKFADTQFE